MQIAAFWILAALKRHEQDSKLPIEEISKAALDAAHAESTLVGSQTYEGLLDKTLDDQEIEDCAQMQIS